MCHSSPMCHSRRPIIRPLSRPISLSSLILILT
ncbi:hypothetical protein LINPERPRIM_LOCUS5233 [Linum perenne]